VFHLQLAATQEGHRFSGLLGRMFTAIRAAKKGRLVEETDIGMKAQLESRGISLLEDSEASYRRTFDLSKSESWALVQAMSLQFALRGVLPAPDMEVARRLHELDLNHADAAHRTWALGALAELSLLEIVNRQFQMIRKMTPNSIENAALCVDLKLRGQFEEHLAGVSRQAELTPNDVRSSLLQLRRFSTVFIMLAASAMEGTDSRSSTRLLLTEWSGSEATFDPRRWAFRDLTAYVDRVVNPLFDTLRVTEYR
ncbi:MAG: hypothetical protein KDA96_18750, partial [Planctomycetaceae bacterium]|nr:hypothetical protein [Planctomycetaceae bacterium]